MCFCPTLLVGKCHTRTALSKLPYVDHPQNSALYGRIKKSVTENVYSLILHITFSEEDKVREEHKCLSLEQYFAAWYMCSCQTNKQIYIYIK